MDIAPILTDLGTTVAVLLLFCWLVWKLVTPFVGRLMDNLDKMSSGYVSGMQTQAEVAATLRELRQLREQDKAERKDRDDAQDVRLAEITEALAEVGGVLRGLQQQQQAHEGRAQKRHEQVMAHADERHAELVAVLKALNGKS